MNLLEFVCDNVQDAMSYFVDTTTSEFQVERRGKREEGKGRESKASLSTQIAG